MDIDGLKQRLEGAGCLESDLRASVLKFLTVGGDNRCSDADFAAAAAELDVEPAKVLAFWKTESSGNPFVDGRPTLLFEPHRFSKATGHRFDATNPTVSYPNWDRTKYPKTQTGRYDQLIDAILLDPLAGFASASYGGAQILGENYARCGARDSMGFAWQESQSEGDQLHHFVLFVKSDPVLHAALKKGDWVTVAKRYNGTGYALNRYDVRLAQNYRSALR